MNTGKRSATEQESKTGIKMKELKKVPIGRLALADTRGKWMNEEYHTELSPPLTPHKILQIMHKNS